MRIVKVKFHPYLNRWVMTCNLWIEDEEHRDTCLFKTSDTKPTERQVRRFKKAAKANFRYGTRAAQRLSRT